MTQALVRKPGDGRTIAVVGDVYRFLATGDDTDGKYALWEALVPPGGGPPPHVHSREEEGFYILEGEITFTIGEKRLVASAGMFANMPVGTPHSFKNESGKPAKMLISVAPAGLEKMFFEFGVPLAEGSTTALHRISASLLSAQVFSRCPGSYAEAAALKYRKVTSPSFFRPCGWADGMNTQSPGPTRCVSSPTVINPRPSRMK